MKLDSVGYTLERPDRSGLQVTLFLTAFLTIVALWCVSPPGSPGELPEALPDLPPFRFADITAQTGISFIHNSDPEKRYIVESMSGGVALFDYNNNGLLDVYFVNSLSVATAENPGSSRSHLYRNNGDGTFSDVTDEAGVGYPGWGMGVAVGDYNGDGRLDLYVTCLGPNRLYRNNGDGTFTEVGEEAGVADPRWSAGAAFGDYDNDGHLDLYVANYVDFRLDNLPRFGEGALCQYRGIPVQCGPRGLPGAGNSLYRNDGDGTFTDVSVEAGVHDPEGYYGLGVIWTDVNQNGRLDLFVANDARPNFLFRNDGDGTFTEVAFFSGIAVGEDGSEQACMGIAAGDYDRDGRLDILVTNFSDEYNTLYRNEADFLYTDMSFASRTAEASFPWVGWGTELVDFNNNGWLDLLAVNGHVYPQVDHAPVGASYAQPKLLYLNNKDGTFTEVSGRAGEALTRKRASRGAAFGDIDNDGGVDAVVNDLDGPPMVLRNESPNRGNWIRVKAENPGSPNFFAIGARVKVVTGDLVQISEIRSGGSYLSQNDLRQHFGLGGAERVDLIEVTWPGGGVTRLEDVEANRDVVIRRGEP